MVASEDQLVYVWQGELQAEKRVLDIHLDIFAEEASGMYRRIQEDQRQRAYERDELFSSLNAAGFSNVQIFGDRTMTDPEPDCLRWHIIAQKRSITDP